MFQNIIAGVLCVIVLAAGVWGWWVDNGGTFKRDNTKNLEECEENKNEKN